MITQRGIFARGRRRPNQFVQSTGVGWYMWYILKYCRLYHHYRLDDYFGDFQCVISMWVVYVNDNCRYWYWPTNLSAELPLHTSKH